MSPLPFERELEALQALRLRLHRLEPPRPLRDARAAAAFVRDRAIVMASGTSGLPVLAEAIVGRHVRGSWMADRDVYRICRVLKGIRRYGILDAPVVLGKETLLTPALGPAVERVAADEARCEQARQALPPLARRLLSDIGGDPVCGSGAGAGCPAMVRLRPWSAGGHGRRRADPARPGRTRAVVEPP